MGERLKRMLLACKSSKTSSRAGVAGILVVLAAAATLAVMSSPAAHSQKKEQAVPKTEAKPPAVPQNPFPQRRKAPGFEGGTAWLNTAGEITLKDVRGKIVILDFWTYCCVNCMHVLPDLKYLEKKYPNELVVIGVHSAKFDTEKETQSIRNAIVRYEIEHPVINDANMTVWRKYPVQAWPTLVVIDPEGFYCGQTSGEGNRKLLEVVIDKLIDYHKAKGTLDRTPVSFALERKKLKPTPLKYPGKVLADARGNRLFVADTNHNRIVVSTLDGKLLDVIGSGAIGNKDGQYHEAEFDHPHGMALVGNNLYVADTENHLIRKIDLVKKKVSRFAGTGRQTETRPTTGKLTQLALNSPWAIEHVDGSLYICMAGSHQIWVHKLGTDVLNVFAGSAREDIINGPHLDAALAQPSGITTDGKLLYVADSEGSAIRSLTVDPEGKVDTVAGASDLPFGRSLFEFGDRDAFGANARFQHPLGVAYYDKHLYVADAYNHKIRKVELTPKGGRVSTFLGDGKPGSDLSKPRFFEPEGVSVAGSKLYIADTNNHRICVADLKTGKTTEFKINGLKPPAKRKPAPAAFAGAAKDAVVVPAQEVASAEVLPIEFQIELPKGFKFNKDFPTRYQVKAGKNQKLIPADQLKGRHPAQIKNGTVSIKLPLAKRTGKATIDLSLSFGYCRAGTGGLCKLKTLRWRIPLVVSAEAEQKSLTLEASVVKKLAKADKSR